MRKPFTNRLQEPATLIQRGPDEIVNRRPVPGAEQRTDITVVSAPPDAAKMRQMLTEGTRLTESRTFWIAGVTVEPVGVGANASGGDVIEYGGVSYRAQITPRGAGGREFGRTLLLTTDPTRGAGAGRVGVFASMDEVARTFAADSGPYQAAQVYFSQVPYPRNLVIGRWINTRESARLTGGSPASLETFHGRPTVVRGSGTVASLDTFHGRATVLTGAGMVADLVNFLGRATVLTGTGTVASLTTLQGITSGTVTFLSQTLTGLDFSDVTDYDDVASVLQTALRATSATSLDEVEVDYDSAASAFVVTLPLDSSGAATSVSAAFTGDDADDLGLDTATIVDGVDAIQSGTITFLSQTLTGLDFSSVTDYDDVASTLQTALRAASVTALASVEVAYQGGVFVVIIPLDSQGAATSVSAAFTGDDADELGLDTVDTVQGSVTSQDYIELTERLTVIPEDITITVLAS